MHQLIAGALQLGAKAEVFHHQFHVGVGEQQIIELQFAVIRAPKRVIARLLEVDEWKAVQFSRQAALSEESPDEILRAVGGARIPYHPAINVIGDRREAPFQIDHLILDDHRQTEFFHILELLLYVHTSLNGWPADDGDLLAETPATVPMFLAALEHVKPN